MSMTTANLRLVLIGSLVVGVATGVPFMLWLERRHPRRE